MADTTPTYDSMRDEVKALIRAAVSDACDFVNDTAPETGFDTGMTIANVREQAVVMMAVLLDPQNADTDDMPQTLKDAVYEFVNAKIGFTILNYGQPS